MKTVKERHEEQRKVKLALIDKQVKAGTLVIRKMTKAERAKYQARTPKPKDA
jgi:hypothetical protein